MCVIGTPPSVQSAFRRGAKKKTKYGSGGGGGDVPFCSNLLLVVGCPRRPGRSPGSARLAVCLSVAPSGVASCRLSRGGLTLPPGVALCFRHVVNVLSDSDGVRAAWATRNICLPAWDGTAKQLLL